jgi:hypothetical protein
MRAMSKRTLLGIAVVAALAVTLALLFVLRGRRGAPAPVAPAPTREASSGAPLEPPPVATRSAEPEPAALPAGFAGVDLEDVRAALPDNSYWHLAAPTDDPALLAEREQAAARRNELYGKVLSGTGSDEEIVAYFEERTRTSNDYVAFADHLLEHYSDELSDQDLTLLHVARRLHLARLEEIPRKLQEARERRAQQEEARRAWREAEREFAEGEATPEDSESAL